MFSDQQASNVFGFSSRNNDSTNFDKTATFFNPVKNQKESSFSTQTTDITRGPSSQNTPKRNKIKPPMPLHTNTPKHWMQTPSLLPLYSTPTSEKSSVQKFPPIVRNCISQEAIRRKVDILKENCKPGTSGGFREEGLYTGSPKNNATSKRIPFLHEDLQAESVLHTQESEYPLDKEFSPEIIDSPNDNLFRIRPRAIGGKGGKGPTITRINKIKVLSPMPVGDMPIPRAPLFKKSISENKVDSKAEIKKRASLEIEVDDPKKPVSLYGEIKSAQTRTPSSFAFPNLVTPKSKGFSPRAPPSIERSLKSPNQASPSPQRVPTFLSKFDDLETFKDIQDLKTPGVEGNKMGMKNFQMERDRYLSVNRNNDYGTMASPPIIRMTPSAHPGKRGFGNDGSLLSPSEFMDLKSKVQARGSLKFKNEQVVLNKLFNPLSQYTKKE